MEHYGTLPLRRVMAADVATQISGSLAPPGVPSIVGATLAVDAESGDALFAYLPMPDVTELRRAITQITFGPSNFTTFGTAIESSTAEHAAVMRYADHVVALLNAITPNCAEPVDVFYGLVNRSNVHLYHRDGDTYPPPSARLIPAGTPWAAMVYLRNNMEGGHLRIPEYDVTLACDDGWGVFFPSAELLHGVTPMKAASPDGYRYSVLYGTLPGAKECFSCGESPTAAGWDVDYIQQLKASTLNLGEHMRLRA